MKPLAICLILAACSTPPQRWLSEQEDADLRAKCEPVGGCVAVPVGLWKQIKEMLAAPRGTAI